MGKIKIEFLREDVRLASIRKDGEAHFLGFRINGDVVIFASNDDEGKQLVMNAFAERMLLTVADICHVIFPLVSSDNPVSEI